MRRLIVTGDDFGLAEPVNEAIVEAHCSGILTTASLMVGASSAADAVERARRVPTLRVGLHIVLVEGRPVLSRENVPDLVDAKGNFYSQLTKAGFRFFFRPGIRRQLEAEIRAQFEAFRQTRLPLDHVNAHNHMHVHPTVLRLILKVGREYGLKAIRLPYEPPLRSWRASRKDLGAKLLSWLFLSPWMFLMRAHLRRANLRFNDFVFGMADSGSMKADLVLNFLDHLPSEGVTEIYFHPATRRCPEIDGTMPGYSHVEEFKTLKSAVLLDKVQKEQVERIAFGDL
jgi:hopanoid biosynthesis associated protein HpnK